MQRLIPTANNTLIRIDPLAVSLDALVGEAKEEAQLNHKKHLVELRKPIIKFIKKHVALVANRFAEINKFREEFLFNLVAVDGCLQTISPDGPTQNQWDLLIHFLKTTNSIKLSNKGKKLFYAIRHEFMVVLQEDSPLRDDLDIQLEHMAMHKSFSADDPQILIDLIYKLSYYLPSLPDEKYHTENAKPFTSDNITALIPAFELLMQKGLFSKANFLRLMLQPHSYVKIVLNSKGEENCNYYDYHSCPFYIYPLIPHEFINNFIMQMNAINIVNQQNLEVLIKTFASKTSLDPRHYAGWEPENLLKAFHGWCEKLKISKYNDRFQELMYAYRRQVELNEIDAAEQARINHANNVSFHEIKNEKIKQHLQQIFHQELAQLPLTAGAEKEADKNAQTLTVMHGDNDELRKQYIEQAEQNIDAIANMQAILHEDKATSGDNLTQLVVHAEHVKELTEAYLLVRETGAYNSPQETFDAVIKVAENSAAISNVIKWLPRKDYSPETIQTILDEAFYAEDFVAVTQYEQRHFQALNQDDKDITSQYLFTVNFAHKKEYLHSLVKIYTFVDKHRLSAGSIVAAMHLRLPLSKALAANLAVIPEDEKFDQIKMISLISQIEQDELSLRKDVVKTVEKLMPAEITRNILKYKYNFSVDFINLANGYLLLKQNRLLQKWEHVIAESANCPIQLASTYASELAGCLVSLHEKQILLPENVALLMLRREVCLAVTTILLKMHECGVLDHENREKLKLNITQAVKISKYCQQMDAQQFKQLLKINTEHEIDIKAIENCTEWYELDDDEKGKPKPMTFAQKEPVDNASDDEIEEEKAEDIVIPEKHISPFVHPKDSSPIITPRELIERCRIDYENTFFGISNFSRKLATRQIDKDNMQQMIAYMKENPRSRTTRVYVNLYIEKLKPGAYKDFWIKYMKSYTFSFYQKSELINKLLEGSIHQHQDIENHALANKSNRTTKLLR